MFIFFIIKSILYLLLDFVTLRTWKKFVKKRNYNKYLYIVPIIIAIITFVSVLFVDYQMRMSFPVQDYIRRLNTFINLWYLPKLPIVVIILIIGLIGKFKNIFLKIFPRKNKPIVHTYNLQKSRRQFIGNTAWSVAGIPFLLAFKGSLFTLYDIRIFREQIYFPKLPRELNGLRILQLSDLHFGIYTTPEYLNDLKQKVENLNPDIIFVTGDFVNFKHEELDYGEKFLKSLQAPYGVWGCLGNHDHYMSEEAHSKLIKRINSTGTKLLINENETIEINGQKINIIGVDNYGSRQTFGDFDKAYEGVNLNNFTILMSHDPNTWEQFIIGKRKTDIMLAGHTHGGQIALEFLGYDMSFAKVFYKYYMGLYSIKDQYLYVNRGIGVTGPPMRVGINPEITLITLKIPQNLV